MLCLSHCISLWHDDLDLPGPWTGVFRHVFCSGGSAASTGDFGQVFVRQLGQELTPQWGGSLVCWSSYLQETIS